MDPRQAIPTDQEIDIPDEFRCPLTMQLLSDPVIIPNTHYIVERALITTWLQGDGYGRCPYTRNLVDPSELIPATALKEQIDRYLKFKQLADFRKYCVSWVTDSFAYWIGQGLNMVNRDQINRIVNEVVCGPKIEALLDAIQSIQRCCRGCKDCCFVLSSHLCFGRDF